MPNASLLLSAFSRIKMHEQKTAKEKDADVIPEGAVPAYLLDREGVSRSKILSNTIKQKRKEKAGKWAVPVPKVKALTEDEMFQIVRSGKRKRKMWKRMINKVSFVGDNFTRKPPKYERFIRPMALRETKAHVTHPELKTTFCLPIIGVKKNPQSHMYTTLGIMTKGTVIEVDVSDLGLVTPGGKVVFGKYARTYLCLSVRPSVYVCVCVCLLLFNRLHIIVRIMQRLQTIQSLMDV